MSVLCLGTPNLGKPVLRLVDELHFKRCLEHNSEMMLSVRACVSVRARARACVCVWRYTTTPFGEPEHCITSLSPKSGERTCARFNYSRNKYSQSAKLSLCLIKHHVIRRIREARYRCSILDTGIRWRLVVSFKPRPL
jgi:hypothetical protein